MGLQCLSTDWVLDVFVNLFVEMLARNFEQFYSIFCVKLGDSDTTTHVKPQQAFGDHAMSRAQAFCWTKMFS
jgi:hypothetical protein